MTIDQTDPRSPSQQIADNLRSAIRDGSLRAGDRLPATRELVEQYGTSSQTVRQAIGILKSEGLVDGQTGSGVFVRKQPPIVRVGSDRYARWRRENGKAPLQAEAEERGLDWRQEVLELAKVPAPGWVSDWFGIDPDTEVFVRRRRTWIEGSPTQLADSYYRLEDVQGTRILQEDTGPGGGHARLEERGLKLRRFREELAVRMPTPEERRSLRLGLGTPVVELHRISYTDDRPVEVFCSIMAGNSHVFAYEFDAPE